MGSWHSGRDLLCGPGVRCNFDCKTLSSLRLWYSLSSRRRGAATSAPSCYTGTLPVQLLQQERSQVGEAQKEQQLEASGAIERSWLSLELRRE